MSKRRSKKRTNTTEILSESTLVNQLPLEKRTNQIIKVSIAGCCGVGKTSLCQRAMGKILDDFFNTYNITIGVQFFTHTIKTKQGDVVMSVWDLAGQPQFQQILDRFIMGSKGVILTFDSTEINSFFSLHHFWIPLIQENCAQNIPILLVSTKNDLSDKREVEPELINAFIDAKDEHKLNIVGYLETSSKNNLNVHETFQTLCNTIIKNELFVDGNGK